MRIVIDLQSMQTWSRFRGIGRYSFCLIKALLEQTKDIDFWILLNDQNDNDIVQVRELFAGLICPEKVVSFAAPHAVNETFSNNQWRARAAELIRSHFLAEMSPDIVLTTSLFELEAVVSIEPSANRHYKAVVIIYDLIPLSEPEAYLPNPVIRRWYDRKLESLRNADLLLAISDYSARDAVMRLRLDPNRCVNISAAADLITPERFTSSAFDSRGSPGVIPENAVLYVGGFDIRKNVDKLVDAYSRLPLPIRKSYPLVLAGKIGDINRSRLMRLAKKFGLAADELHFTDFVPDELLVDLYRSCRLFVFPSSSEGFGLPPLEAMHYGAAVIAAARTSLIEVVGSPDALFDPDDVASLATLLNKGLTDDQFRTRLIANGAIQATKFSWSATAQKALDALTFIGAQPILIHGSHDRDVQSVEKLDTAESERNGYSKLINDLGAVKTDSIPDESDLVVVAQSIGKNIDVTSNHFSRDDQSTINSPSMSILTDPIADLSFKENVLPFGRMKAPYAFRSTLCRAQHFRMPLYKYWCDALRETPRFHRKQWEYVFICQALFERGFLAPGKRAVGFGVGREPLVSLFALHGVTVLASDLDIESARYLGWASTNQHCADPADLNQVRLCDPDDFNRLVTFKNINMNSIPVDIGCFDFCWSSCALEHLGSIRRGLDFMLNSARLLNPGGIAVHTTEFNLTSNERTVDNNECFVIFRRQDIELLVSELRAEDFVVEEIDYCAGSDPLEQYVDLPPYRQDLHLRLQLAGEFTSTSIGLIIRRL
jgi:glycosyltransferase involved in cell wall biosynthesis